MMPLISDSTFEKLRTKRSAISGRPAHVFLPVAQENPQLLFVGHASRGEMCDGTYIDVAETTYKWLVDSLRVPGTSGFWRAASSIVDQCSRIVSPDGGGLPVGWSNLCKIGDVERNPLPKSICEQADICIETLLEELHKAKPKITLLLTGHFAQDEIIFPLFGRCGWRNNVKSEDLVAVKEHPDFGVVLWGYHPRDAHGMKRHRELVGFMAGFSAARLLLER